MIFDFSPEFFKWEVTDDRGALIGIRDGAPEEIKQEYAEYLKAKNQYSGSFLIK